MTKAAPPCPVCESVEVRSFLDVRGTPVLCNVLWATRAEAMAAPRGDIRLAFCPQCGHVYNQAFDPTLLHYAAGYENSLHFSARFQEYADKLADGLIERFDLRGRDIIEVGCGQGDFLRSLCEKGRNRGVGFDPSYRRALAPSDEEGDLSFVTDLYDERYAHLPVDFVCSRHVLEHIQHPITFLEGIRRTIGEGRPVGLFFEVPDVAFTLRNFAIWDLIYEHCSYFSRPSIARLFADRGFNVESTYGTFGSQFLCIEATTGDVRGGSGSDGDADPRDFAGEIADFAAAVEDFPARYQAKVDAWRQSFGLIRDQGRRAVVWGAGSKGVSILNVLREDHPVDLIVDLNPRKHGMYVSGTGQEIVSPEHLRDYRPDVVVGMNAIYADEIQAMLNTLGVKAELVFA